MNLDAMARLVERAALEVEAAQRALDGQAAYLQQVAEGLVTETIHPDHLPVVGNQYATMRQQVESALAQGEQHLYLAN